MTSTANVASRERRKRVLFAGTMVCAVGAATTLSNTFDFDIDFSFSTSPAGTNTAKKAGGLRAGSSASPKNFQRRLELASAEYMSGGVGDAPEDIVKFLAKYGLEMKDLELMAQLKGVKVDESVSSTTSTSTSSSTTTLGETSTSSITEETSNGDDASAALLSSFLAGSSEESSLTTTEEGDETSTEETSGGLNSLLSSFLGSSSGNEETSTTTEETGTTTESTTEETSSGSASPLDLASLMGSMSAELSTTETETETESQPEEAVSLESLMSSSTTTTETAPVETATKDTAPTALNPEQQAMMMQMMASGSMTPEQQQQMMEMMLGQSAGGDATTTTATSTDSLVLPTSTDSLVVPTSTDASSTMAFESTANAAPGFGVGGMANFKDSWEPWDPSDIPVFFHIPKAGGSSVKDNIGSCHRFTMATEYGVTDGHDQDTEIAVVYPAGGPPGSDRSPFVNVDTTTVAGIQRAKDMGFADAGLADAVVTGFLYEANDLFTPTAKGRMFTVFRHPIERAISMFYYIQVADWEPTYSPELKDWTIEQYAESDRIENNWMTRQLSGQLSGDLNDDALAVAMEVIRSKFLVGLMTEMDRTMERFEKFFRWKFKVNPPNQEACRERLMSGGSNSNSANKKETPKEGDIAWEKLMWQNQYDMQLYDFIVELFEEQEAFVSGIPDGYRLIDATCCKCDPPTFPPEGYECPKAIQN